MRGPLLCEKRLWRSFHISTIVSMKITLLAIYLDIELRSHERSILLHRTQACNKGSLRGGFKILTLTNPNLFLATRDIIIDHRQVMKLSPCKGCETITIPGLSPLWRKNGLDETLGGRELVEESSVSCVMITIGEDEMIKRRKLDTNVNGRKRFLKELVWVWYYNRKQSNNRK